MSALSDNLTALRDEVRRLKDSETDRLRKEVSFLKALQQRRGLSRTNLISRDECVGYLNSGISSFIAGS